MLKHKFRNIQSDRLRFDDFELIVESGELLRQGRSVPLRPQATRVLEQLLRHRPNLVSRADLRDAVWGQSHVDWEAGLHQIVRQLRIALEDDSQNPRYIETVPRRGYRFTAAVLSRPQLSQQLRSVGRDAGLWLAGGLTLPMLVILVCALLAR